MVDLSSNELFIFNLIQLSLSLSLFYIQLLHHIFVPAAQYSFAANFAVDKIPITELVVFFLLNTFDILTQIINHTGYC